MSAEHAHCKSQILRFAGRIGFPLTEEGLRDLVDALEGAGEHRGAVSNDHASATVDALEGSLTSTDRCPRTADIRRVLHELRPPEKRAGCPRCRGYSPGWVLVTVRGVEAAAECACRTATTAKETTV